MLGSTYPTSYASPSVSGGFSGAAQYAGSSAATYVRSVNTGASGGLAQSYGGASAAFAPSYASGNPGYANTYASTSSYAAQNGEASYESYDMGSTYVAEATYSGAASYAAPNGPLSYNMGPTYGAETTYSGSASAAASYPFAGTGTAAYSSVSAPSPDFMQRQAPAPGAAVQNAAMPGYAASLYDCSAFPMGAGIGLGGNLGGFSAPQFVFGVGGPSLPTAASLPLSGQALCPYSVGQSVEVYSVSEGGWVLATVSAVSTDGTVTASYGTNDKQKDILKAQHESHLRPAAAALTFALPAQTGKRYEAGESVQVFSKGDAAWVPAKVTSVAENGTVSVKWGPRNQKDIAPHFFDEYLRPSAPADFDPRARAPATMVSDSTSPFYFDEIVEVYSRSEGGWVQALVQDVAPDGTVTVKWGPHLKKIQPPDYEGFLRHLDASPNRPQGSPTSLGFSSHTTALPPTLPGDFSMSSDFGVAPPTIPGGYSGMGGFAISSPMQNYSAGASEIPPTNFSGVAPPTNYGGPSAGSDNLHYHGVPAPAQGSRYS